MKFSAAGGWFGGDWYERNLEGAKYGFRGVEQLNWLGLDLDKARANLESCGVTSTAVVIQSSDKENGKLTSWGHGMVWEDSRRAFVESFRETVTAAKALGIPNIIATTGNERSDVSRGEQTEICIGTLREMSKIAEDEGVQIVLEPLNVIVDHKGHFLVTTKEAAHIVREVGSPSCKILFDIYHQQISEGNVIRNIRENIDLIGHFHIADNPGRKQPGTGELNYRNIFAAIKETGYNGWLAFECGSTVSTAELAKAMHELVDEYEE